MASSDGLGDILHDPGDRGNVDIVFVHGLGGDKIGTWTWDTVKERSQFWPQSLLPKDCPTARILSFGYTAELLHFFPQEDGISKQLTIDDHSTSLMQSLVNLREETDTSGRPLIFVAHNLGGLVCANTLSRNYETDRESRNLSSRTVGIVFLGTPFEGTSELKWGLRAMKILDAAGGIHGGNVNDLEERSAKLMGVDEAFREYAKVKDRSAEQFEIACCFEEYPTFKEGERHGFFVVPEDSARLPCFDTIPFPANHIDMCKIEHEFIVGYKRIVQQLRQWIKSLYTITIVGDVNNSVVGSEIIHIHEGTTNYSDHANRGGVITGHINGTKDDAVRLTGSVNSYVFSSAPEGSEKPDPGLDPPD